MTPLIAKLLAPLLLALAQDDRIQFDVSRHLMGFDEAYLSPYSVLYDFERFEEVDGHMISVAELRKVLADWKAVQEKVAAEIERINSDPVEQELFRFEKRVRAYRQLGDRGLVKVDVHHPFVFFVQTTAAKKVEGDKPKGARPTPVPAEKPPPKPAALPSPREVVQYYAPIFRTASEALDEEFFKPLGLLPSPRPIPVVVVDPVTYTNYWKSARMQGSYTVGGDYSATLRGIVLSWHKDAWVRRSSAILGLVHALLHPPKTPTVASVHYWAAEGLAGLASRRTETGPLSERSFKTLAEHLVDSRRREAYLWSLADLTAITSHDELLERVRPKASRLPATRLSWVHTAHRAMQIQAAFLVQFFGTDESSMFAAALEALLDKKAVERPASPQLRDLQQRFAGFLQKQYQQHHPELKVPESAFDWLATVEDRPRKELAAPTPRARPSADATPAPEPPRRLEPSLFAVAPSTSSRVLALAFNSGVQGRYREAAAMLEEFLVSELPAGEVEVRLAVEQQRMLALDGLRRDLVQSFAESGRPLRVSHTGRELRGKVTATGPDSFTLQADRDDPVTLPFTALDSAELSLRIIESKFSGGPDWVRAYAFVLGENSRAKRQLRGKGEEKEALRSQEAEFAELRRTGQAMARLGDLSQRGLPGTFESAVKAHDDVATLLVELGTTEPVMEKRELLIELARRALEIRLDGGDLSILGLHCKITSIQDGGVRLEYGFDSAAELEDFRRDDGYLPDHHAELQPVRRAAEDWSVVVQRGRLCLRGAVCLHHRLSFAAPMRLEYDLTYMKSNRVPEGAPAIFRLGFCDDGEYARIQSLDAGNMVATAMNFYQAGEIKEYFIGSLYRLEVEHDGERARSKMNGNPRSEVQCGQIKSGGLNLWAHSDYEAVLSKLVIEAHIDPRVARSFDDDAVLACIRRHLESEK